MNTTQLDYARSQADGLNNIAPTTVQGERAWQYAQSDNFFSPEEQADVMRRQLEPYRQQIESKLTAVGWDPEHLANHPHITSALFSGQQTPTMGLLLTPDVKMYGSLRVVMTEEGPDIRVTSQQQKLQLPKDILLSRSEVDELSREGSLARPFMLADKGEYLPTYLRVNEQTNTVELWRIKAVQLPTKLMGIDLTKDQQLQLAHGHPVRLTGLLDNQGEPFNATVSLSAAKQSLQFTDLSRLDVSLKPGQEFKNQLAQNNEGAKTDLTKSNEQTIGAPTVSNRQSDAIKEVLEMETQDRTLKPRR